jgi:uncharacterized membrane protein YccC
VGILEFISSLRWPITVLVLAGGGYWAAKHNKGLQQTLREMFTKRNMRLNLGGQEFEISGVAEIAETAALAAQSDAQLARMAAEEDSPRRSDVTEMRRDLLELVVQSAAHWGWRAAKAGVEMPPEPIVTWTEDGVPEIRFKEYEPPRKQ